MKLKLVAERLQGFRSCLIFGVSFLRGSSASKEHMCLDLDDRISGMIMVMMTKFWSGC